ncbi:PepSY domain-containing protein [Polaribacter vadi]|uniref:PepSY domain-containing protein n=1 Tax=Polaribacter TaxID=52959 RepID=UPI001C080881|nr:MULTISPECIES: PepSY domain-containing protein [Polaribacter]MBU3012932.1 PepSY domain-containing protein [Polaribacter vadi]MDO6742750.1 PepSY domain-containing protein [Polaribacter sp. 1_MG-2023]
MTISIWRYSHLTLAISTALFIIIASLTGIILAFEPIFNKLQPYSTVNIEQISIAETVAILSEKYDEIITLEVDENNFVSASVVTKDGKSETFYLNPKTGKKVGDLIEKSPIFEFATNLHRSLFLKSTGRFLIGFVSFLLLLIAISGVILIAKRQGGFFKVFTKIVKENFNQYYHIVFGRWFLIPIIIITITGVYLSLEKFSLLPKDKNKHQKNTAFTNTTSQLKPTDFDFFKTTKLADVTSLEFPFSSDEEDYFYLKTIDNEFAIHQFNGQIVSNKKQSLTSLGSYYSLILHTGQGSILWSIVLLLACFALLFFIFSGFSLTIKRRKNTSVVKNRFNKDDAEFIILVGSETGSTYNFATVFYKAILSANKKVFITDLNSYTTFKKAKNIIVFAATYGDGEAPINATKFLAQFKKVNQTNTIQFSVVGFGSTDYQAYCKYAILVHSSLQIQDNFIPVLPISKIDNQSFTSFKNWLKEWNSYYKLNLHINKEDLDKNKPKEQIFTVINKTELNCDGTFLIELKPSKKIKFTSGDLLSITPKNETKSRLYSIAKVDENILLSIKKHEFGVCSNYLNFVNKNNKIVASIVKNDSFHFPKKAKEIILIANGTGIAPFLGMITKKSKKKIHLFWGGRTKESFKIYQKKIENAIENKNLTSFHSAFSQEQKEKNYVQDLLKNHSELIVRTLKNGDKILICGSLAMQRGVISALNTITEKSLRTTLKVYQENHQIKTDCY